MDVVFYHLKPQWMELPPLENGDEKARVERAAALARTASFCASQAMTKIFMFAPASLQGQLVKRFLHHLDDFSAWLKFLAPAQISQHSTHLIQYADPSRQCATLLYLLSFEGVLGQRLLESDHVVEYSIAAWVAREPVHNKIYGILDQDALCPIMHLFTRLLLMDETRDRIFHAIYSATNFKRLRTDIIEAAVSRCTVLLLPREKVEERAGGSASGVKVIFMYLGLIIGIVQQLCIHPDFRAAFMKSAFFEEFFQILRIWLLERSDGEKERQDRYEGFRLMARALSLVALASVEGERRYSEGIFNIVARRVIRGGFIPLLLESIHSIPVDDGEQEMNCRCSLAWLVNACAQHPSLFEPVHCEFVKLLGESFWSTKAFARTGWKVHFKIVALDIVAGHRVSGKKRCSLCDNFGVSPRAFPVIIFD